MRRLLEALLVVALIVACGVAGRMDYEDRCRDLAPASIEEGFW